MTTLLDVVLDALEHGETPVMCWPDELAAECDVVELRATGEEAE
jgi:hypothetical protein